MSQKRDQADVKLRQLVAELVAIADHLEEYTVLFARDIRLALGRVGPPWYYEEPPK